MRPANSLVLAAMSATASAAVSQIEVIHIVESIKIDGTSIHDLLEGSSSNNANSARALFAKRATEEECSSSISSFIDTTPTGAPGITDFLESAIETDGCDITAHTTMSSDIFEYLTDSVDWVFENLLIGEELLSKCGDELPEPTPLGTICDGGATFYFTGGQANATSTVRVADAMSDYSTPAPKQPDSAAVAVGASYAAVAAAGILAVAASF